MKTLTVSDWAAVVSAVMAAAAFAVSLLAWRISNKAQRLAEQQEARRAPKLEVRLLESFSRTLPARGRLFAFKLLITNPTDTSNAIASLELSVRYRRDLPMTLRIPAVPGAEVDESSGLVAPLRIDAHQTEAGWFYFLAAHELLAGATIDGYEVVATDTHMVPTGAESLVVFERPI